MTEVEREREFVIILFEDVYREFGRRRLDLYAGRVNKCRLRNRQPAGSCGSKDLNICGDWAGAGHGFFCGLVWVGCKRITLERS